MKQATVNRPKACRNAKRDEIPDVRKLKLVPMLKRGEPWIPLAEALRRARANPLTNHGKRFAMKFADACNAATIPQKVWRIGWHVIFGKGSWRHRYGPVCAWFVYRNALGFYCRCSFLTGHVYSFSRRLASK